MIKIRKIDVINVYPEGEKSYFGKKWAVVSYELNNGIKGAIDVPLPHDSDDIHPVAIDALNYAIRRKAFDTERQDYATQAA